MKKLIFLLFFATFISSYSQKQIRICSYDVGKSGWGYNTYWNREIFSTINPALLIVQNIKDSTVANSLLDTLRKGRVDVFELSDFYTDSLFNTALYINFDKLNFGYVNHYKTPEKDILHYMVYTTSPIEHIHIFSVFLKQGYTQEAARSGEIEALRKYIPTGDTNVIILGNFGFSSSNESGYHSIFQWEEQQLFDPLGKWEPNSADYIEKYTYATYRVPGHGNDTLGLADRFHMILYSKSLEDNYIPGSYKNFGNDSTDRRKSSINFPENKAVNKNIASALSLISANLPVYADFVFSYPSAISYPDPARLIKITESSDNIHMFLPTEVKITVSNSIGQTVVAMSNYIGEQRILKQDFKAGIYFLHINALNNSMITEHHKFIVAP